MSSPYPSLRRTRSARRTPTTRWRRRRWPRRTWPSPRISRRPRRASSGGEQPEQPAYCPCAERRRGAGVAAAADAQETRDVAASPAYCRAGRPRPPTAPAGVAASIHTRAAHHSGVARVPSPDARTAVRPRRNRNRGRVVDDDALPQSAPQGAARQEAPGGAEVPQTVSEGERESPSRGRRTRGRRGPSRA